MTILKIIEALQSYSEDILAYKLDGQFANAVTEAVSLLIRQGEQIADLQNELRDERWIPVYERLPKEFISVLVCIPSEHPLPMVKEAYMANNWWTTKFGVYSQKEVTHWMPLPEPPKEVQHDE